MLEANHIEDLVKRAAEFGEGKLNIIINNGSYEAVDDSMI